MSHEAPVFPQPGKARPPAVRFRCNARAIAFLKLVRGLELFCDTREAPYIAPSRGMCSGSSTDGRFVASVYSWHARRGFIGSPNSTIAASNRPASP